MFMECIDRIFFRKINPSDFKKLYDIDKPENGGGQTYLEAAGINPDDIIDFLSYAEISDSTLDGEERSIYTFYAHVLGNPNENDFLEFAPRKGRINYRISRQNMKYKHPAWSISNGFPEPLKNDENQYTSNGNFLGIIDNLLIIIIRTTYRKYYASFIDLSEMPKEWPSNIGLEALFEGDRRGVLSFKNSEVEFVNNRDTPFGRVLEKSNISTFENNIIYKTGLASHFSRNRIIFGAPGTGKSYKLNEDSKDLLVNGGEYERVTFHPDYSYANFVGTYKPVPLKDENNNEIISYKFVPGPFIRLLVKALKSAKTNSAKPYLLIIEEINRSNIASVFGDVFQLLDRDSCGVSEYSIQTSEDLRLYLCNELGGDLDNYSSIKIPNNMYLWATMNSADQGVFPMDTAFKRRWEFTYLGINENEVGIDECEVSLKNGVRINWNNLRRAINEVLINEVKVNEDKLMGPYFISKDNLDDSEKFVETFKNKVIMYLFDDAAKHRRAILFSGCKNYNLFSEICTEFDQKGVLIFSEEVAKKSIISITENPFNLSSKNTVELGIVADKNQGN